MDKPAILVVDDEALVRNVLQTALRQLNFEVWLAASGEEALRVYRDTLALVLMDVRMPGLTGPQTLLELRQSHPNVRCGFITGDSSGFTDADLLELGARFVLRKPFSLAELSQAVGEVAARS